MVIHLTILYLLKKFKNYLNHFKERNNDDFFVYLIYAVNN